MFKKKIKLSGEIDASVQPAVIKIKATSEDVWTDFGYWLEAINFMAYQAMIAQGWTKNEIIDYTVKYLQESLDDIEVKQ